MAVDTTTTDGAPVIDVSTLLGGGKMGNLFGQNDGSGGMIGGLILGSLLRNGGNLLGGENAVGGYHKDAATATDVQNTVGFVNTIQDINSARRDIFQAQAGVQSQIANAVQTQTLNSLQGQIATLNGMNDTNVATLNSFANVNQNIAGTAANAALAHAVINQNIAKEGADILAGQNILNQNLATVSANIAQGQAALNQNISTTSAATQAAIAANAYVLTTAITNDGDKTRALIQNIETASLNRQITVAQNEISELRNERSSTASGINVTNNISQSQAQAQAQQQAIVANSLLSQLVGEIQKNTNSVVNLGSMVGSGQTATNVRA